MMVMNRSMSLLTAVLLAGSTMAFATEPTASDPSVHDLVRNAQQAIEAGRYDDALDLFSRSREAMPLNAELPYNMAVAAYRAGDYERAASLFNETLSLTSDPALRARSIFNLGNAAYAQTLKALAGGADPQQAQGQMEQAKQHLKDAIESYKHALEANPSDEDARANAELAHRFLRALEETPPPPQQQQEQDQQNQEQSEQQQENQPQSGESEQPPPQSQPEAPQQPQGSSEDQEKQQQQQQQNQSEQQPAEQKPQPGQEQQAQPQDNQAPPHNQGQHVQHEQRDPKAMSREAAERLLQAVRDKDRQRRAELARREAARHAPVEKDW